MANPSVILQGGRIIGIWRFRQQGKRTLLQARPFVKLNGDQEQQLQQRVSQWTDFQQKEVILQITA